MTSAVVTIAHGRHEHLAAQRRSLLASDPRPDHHVVVAMDDPGIGSWRPTGDLVPHVVRVGMTPLGLPLAAARNAGVAAASGRPSGVMPTRTTCGTRSPEGLEDPILGSSIATTT